jgi:hypothetical protein
MNKIIIVTIYSDEEKLIYLKNSARIKNINIHYLFIKWNGFIDKIIHMIKFLDTIEEKNSIICFIDAYDIIINQNSIETLYEKFINQKCNILFSSELVCFPFINKIKYNEIELNKINNIETNFKYLNSGGYIGYYKYVYHMLKSKNLYEIKELCNIGGDQNFFTYYYLEYYNLIDNNNLIHIKLDYNQIIFQSMCCVNFNDFEFMNGILYNKYLNSYPFFIHFNGFGDNDIKYAVNEKNEYINIIEEFLEIMIKSINSNKIQLNYGQYDEIYIKQK